MEPQPADASARVVALVKRARRFLPGDPEFGDPLSTAGQGAPRAAAAPPGACSATATPRRGN
ncbi:hypothetical protein MCHIJ_35770 [Mycolicibacterium chitae]|nr:hypothetical protein MCHIJ_35770 [Mycolicibacterium chitae]